MYSVCRHCGTALLQGADRKWRPMTAAERTEFEAAREAARQERC